jgi:hypothetical protein
MHLLGWLDVLRPRRADGKKSRSLVDDPADLPHRRSDAVHAENDSHCEIVLAFRIAAIVFGLE